MQSQSLATPLISSLFQGISQRNLVNRSVTLTLRLSSCCSQRPMSSKRQYGFASVKQSPTQYVHFKLSPQVPMVRRRFLSVHFQVPNVKHVCTFKSNTVHNSADGSTISGNNGTFLIFTILNMIIIWILLSEHYEAPPSPRIGRKPLFSLSSRIDPYCQWQETMSVLFPTQFDKRIV